MIPMNLNDTTTPNSKRNINFENIIEMIFDRFSKGLRIIGPIFAFALTLFVLIVTHAFFDIILPYWIKKFGILVGILLAFTALFHLFSILFNYFLAVLVRPGSVDDIRRSKFYRKADPLTLSSSVINFSSVWDNKLNSSKDDNNNMPEGNEVKLRLKAAGNLQSSDNIAKENLLISYANSIPNNIDEDCNDEIFQKHLDSKLNLLNNDSEASNIIYYDGTTNTAINSINTTNSACSRLSDCRFCKQPKVIRAHHCSICGYCVMKMDHHCPWINNCVGQNNHRYFLLFLTHLLFGSFFICITSIPIVFNTKLTKTMEFNFVSVLAFVGFLLMIFFNSWNWFLVYRGNTTIEFWSLKGNFGLSKAIKDFSMPDWRDNIFLVFGTKNLLRAVFIPSIKRLPFSGLEWTKLSVTNYNFEVIEYSTNEINEARIYNI